MAFSNEELAMAFTAHQQARHRLSERFRNRGFFPSRPFAGGNKGKSSGFKGSGKGKGPTPSPSRPKCTLHERILNSTCRACGQHGHWKAECPTRQQNSGAAASGSGGTTAPTTMVVGEQSTLDSLPLEFVNLPERFAKVLEMDNVSFTSSVCVFLVL